MSAFDEIKMELNQEEEVPVFEFPGPKMPENMDLDAVEKEVAHDEEVKVNYSQFVKLFSNFSNVLID